MNKYFINIDGVETPIEADFGDNEIQFKDLGKDEFVYRFITDDLLLLRVDHKNYLVKAEHVHDSDMKNTEFLLEYNSKAYKVVCKNELEILTEKFAASRGGVKIKNELVSPMPGAIVKINVKEGDEVKKGDVLVVLEAMKMENELKAAADCKVQKVLVEEKTPVDKNQVLIKFEV
ncbi:MAG: biotin/lipoyl-binding protein [Bacteroidetes bacterium]|nr:biotin/lipoyl-binding protein [Bacteroidota bacterium]